MKSFIKEKILLFIVIFIQNSVYSQPLSANSHALIFDPHILTVAVGHNASTTIQLVSEYDETVHVSFSYGDEHYPTTDYIQPLEPIDFLRRSGRMQIVLPIFGIRPGQVIVGCNASPVINSSLTDHDFLRVNIVRSRRLEQLINVFGWLYFAAWSCSFYPQIFLNLHRQSVVGLNFDFLALNLVGFFCYSVYNIALYSWRDVQNGYRQLHPHGVIPVLINDIVFGLHGFIATFITIIQCILFERSNQRVSYVTSGIIGLIVVFLTITTILTSVGKINILLLIYFYSYVKLCISCIKYIPQVWMNYQRKSTVGWSIGNILLDLSGGILSLIQMILFAINYNDWKSFFGSMTKFGLAILSIGFDLIFIIQHYVLYRSNEKPIDQGYEIIDGNEETPTVVNT